MICRSLSSPGMVLSFCILLAMKRVLSITALFALTFLLLPLSLLAYGGGGGGGGGGGSRPGCCCFPGGRAVKIGKKACTTPHPITKNYGTFIHVSKDELDKETMCARVCSAPNTSSPSMASKQRGESMLQRVLKRLEARGFKISERVLERLRQRIERRFGGG